MLTFIYLILAYTGAILLWHFFLWHEFFSCDRNLLFVTGIYFWWQEFVSCDSNFFLWQEIYFCDTNSSIVTGIYFFWHKFISCDSNLFPVTGIFCVTGIFSCDRNLYLVTRTFFLWQEFLLVRRLNSLFGIYSIFFRKFIPVTFIHFL